MIKKLSIIVLISASLFSQGFLKKPLGFDEFLDNALKNTPYLKASNLSISQAEAEGFVQTRYENPSLELEYSLFKPTGSDNDDGYRIGLTQPLRLPGVGSDKKGLSDAMVQRANSLHSLNKAEFIRDISLLFTLYTEQKKRLLLGSEELEIAKHIFEISLQRNLAGTISKGAMLQAQVDYEMVEIKTASLNLDIQKSYFNLLTFSGLSKEIELDFMHKFEMHTNPTSSKSPKILYFQAEKEEALASSKVNSNSVEWIDISFEYENEIDQDIYRVATSIPLALFNTSSQEMRIAKLEASKKELSIKNENAKLSIEKIRLKKQRDLLLLLKTQNEKTLKTQTKLLKMFEDGYKIANINLLELQNIKNRVIKTKENLIKIDTTLNQNTITTNYIAGAYNE